MYHSLLTVGIPICIFKVKLSKQNPGYWISVNMLNRSIFGNVRKAFPLWFSSKNLFRDHAIEIYLAVAFCSRILPN